MNNNEHNREHKSEHKRGYKKEHKSVELEIRYTKDGDIESYDPRTGKTVGHISTMGNMMEWTKEDKERAKKREKEAERFFKALLDKELQKK